MPGITLERIHNTTNKLIVVYMDNHFGHDKYTVAHTNTKKLSGMTDHGGGGGVTGGCSTGGGDGGGPGCKGWLHAFHGIGRDCKQGDPVPWLHS